MSLFNATVEPVKTTELEKFSALCLLLNIFQSVEDKYPDVDPDAWDIEAVPFEKDNGELHVVILRV